MGLHLSSEYLSFNSISMPAPRRIDERRPARRRRGGSDRNSTHPLYPMTTMTTTRTMFAAEEEEEEAEAETANAAATGDDHDRTSSSSPRRLVFVVDKSSSSRGEPDRRPTQKKKQASRTTWGPFVAGGLRARVVTTTTTTTPRVQKRGTILRAVAMMMLIVAHSSSSTRCCWFVGAATSTSSATSTSNNGGGSPAASDQQQYQQHEQQLLLDQQRQQLADAQRAIRQTLEEMKRHSTLAGSIKPILQKLVLSETELNLLWKSVSAVAHWEDLIIILMLGWTVVPALQYPYQVLQPNQPYDSSVAKLLAEHVQHIGKLALLVYAVDLVKMVAVGLGLLVVDNDKWAHLPHCFAQSLYTIYAANRLVKLKKHYLRSYINRHPEVFGRAKLLNRLVDAAIYGLAVVLVLGYLKVEMGVAVQSVLALGSVGTLAVGLASQGIISQILHGLLLASNARIYEGDSIQLSNGQKGTIVHLGWLETTLRGSDEIMVSIPNADLLKQHVSNLSRVRYCQVTQQLHFKHKDIPKLHELTQSIKQEIQLSCPEVIVDGSRPFRAYWTDIHKDGVTVTVDAHFTIRPTVEQYWENRQRVLQAIHRACVLHQVEFHVPHLSELLSHSK